MDIFAVLSMLGGLALFIYGMHQMGDCLQRAAGDKLKNMVGQMTSGKLRGVLLGAGVTAIIQSSTVTTVTVVGFVNSGIMQLGQAIPVIMGANIGTTITSWFLSLTGISDANIVLRLLKPTSFSCIFALVGIALMYLSKNSRRREIGSVFISFAIMMFGMSTMTGAFEPLANVPEFQQAFLLFENPFLGMIVGALLTGIMHSSAASIGILQALTLTGGVSYAAAIPIIMGQNIGTCMTALVSGVGASKNARRASMVHLYFNVIGSVLFIVLFSIIRGYFPFFATPCNSFGIAVVHTIFNCSTTLMLLPFSNVLERLAILSVPDKKASSEEAVLLDERLLGTPSLALNRCSELTVHMSEMSKNAILDAIWLLGHYDEQTAEHIEEVETQVDHFEDILGTFCMRLNNLNLSEAESRSVSRILHGIGDFERISDHAVNLKESAQEISEKGVRFTQNALDELNVLYRAIRDIMDIAFTAFNRMDPLQARRVEPLEEVVDTLIRELKSRHIRRLRQGLCTVETGFVFGDLLTNLERVADHCSNLAVCVIEMSMGELNTHEYMEKAEKMEEFVHACKEDLEKYPLPEEDLAGLDAPALASGK